MRKIKFALLFGILSVDAAAQGSLLQPGNAAEVKVSPERLKRVDQLLERKTNDGLINGAVGLIARNGKIVYHKAFGVDDIDGKTPMKKDAIFRIASQTKAITSVAVMMLYEEGKFLLDDPLSKYIPAFENAVVIDKFNAKDTSYTTKPAKGTITIRHLLTHTSGIDYTLIGTDTMSAIYAKAGIPFGNVSEPILLSDAMNKLAKLPLRHHPGERFTYGLNMDILGYLVEIISKMTFNEFLQQRLFKPLGMIDTYFYLPTTKQDRLVAVNATDGNSPPWKRKDSDWPYLNTNYPNAKGTYYSGGAGLSSTIMDYAIFLQMMLNGGQYNGHRILSKHTIDLMTTNQIGSLQWSDPHYTLDRYGLGFAIITKAGEARLGQSEGSYEWVGAYSTFFWVDPKKKLVCLIYSQQVPFSWELDDRFKAVVYQALED
jgi:CubicO group peptidase (beta-lactamase class C family)